MQLWARGRMEGRKEGKARGEARLGRAVSRARQRGNELNGDQKERFEWRGAMECRDFIRRRLDKTFPVARAEIEKEVCTCPLSLENERFSPSSSSFFFAALSLSLRPTKTRFPFVLTARLLFQRNCPFPYIPFPPPPHRLVFLLVLAITLLFPSDHGENVVSHLMLAGHRAPHIKGVRF